MEEEQKILSTLRDWGYSTEEIAAKLSAFGIRFTLDGDKFTFLEDTDKSSHPEETTSILPAAKGEETTILSCMSDIVESGTTHSNFNQLKFNTKVYDICKKQIDYVCKMVGITPDQVVLLSFIIENKGKHNFDKHELAQSMGLSFIKLLSYDKALKGLAEKRLINIFRDDFISVGRKTIEALTKNETYSIPECKGLNTSELLKEMKEIIYSRASERTDFDTMMNDLDILFANNRESGLVKAAEEAGFNCRKMDEMDKVVFYVLVVKYIYENDDAVCWDDFDCILEDETDLGLYVSLYNEGRYDLQMLHIIEPCNENGMASPNCFHITDSVKANLFAEVGGVRNSRHNTPLKITYSADIPEKELFYNLTEGEQIRRLTNLLDQKNYKATCERLKASGMRTGFTCIFYGGPGTGKTESVYQIAKATGRGIVPVNVSEIKSCWVGESEKLIKSVFDRYNALVKESDVAPILLFNEADAIFGIRQEGAERAVDKMENAIQNIILQEMEKLDGVLIATTNLTQNLDKAFERRFLYKIKFNKPGLEPKTKIWQSMIPDLTAEQARELAEGFDFSGGQIENISRKKMIKSIIDGTEPDFAEVKGYCGEELIQGKGGECRKIGF